MKTNIIINNNIFYDVSIYPNKVIYSKERLEKQNIININFKEEQYSINKLWNIIIQGVIVFLGITLLILLLKDKYYINNSNIVPDLVDIQVLKEKYPYDYLDILIDKKIKELNSK